MSHTQSFPLPFPHIPQRQNSQESFVYWSTVPTAKAIVFLHGLCGDPKYTWGLEFFRQLRASPKSTGYDIYSLGYNSTRPAMLSMVELMTFTKALFDRSLEVFVNSVRAGQFVDQPDPRDEFSYEKVLFVCHSLGGLLFRRMIAEAHTNREVWADRIDSVLFAPAHRGGRPLELAMECGTPLIGAATYLHLYLYPVLQDLRPGSIFVADTAQRTTAAINNIGNRAATSLVCNHVVHADGDRVVDIQAPFCSDPLPFEILYNHSHTSICKVNHNCDDALMSLLQVLP